MDQQTEQNAAEALLKANVGGCFPRISVTCVDGRSVAGVLKAVDWAPQRDLVVTILDASARSDVNIALREMTSVTLGDRTPSNLTTSRVLIGPCATDSAHEKPASKRSV